MTIPMHRLPHPANSPTPDRTVLERIKRLDRHLVVFWANYMVLPDCTENNFVPLPRWNVAYFNEEYNRFYLIKRLENEDGSFQPLDMRAARDLEMDALRLMTAQELIDKRAAAKEAQKTAADADRFLRTKEFAKDNRKKFSEVGEHPTAPVETERDSKIFSGTGGSLSRGRVEKSSKELGVNTEALGESTDER